MPLIRNRQRILVGGAPSLTFLASESGVGAALSPIGTVNFAALAAPSADRLLIGTATCNTSSAPTRITGWGNAGYIWATIKGSGSFHATVFSIPLPDNPFPGLVTNAQVRIPIWLQFGVVAPSNGARFNFWVATGLSSFAPCSTLTANGGTNTVVTGNLNTPAGAVAVMAAYNDVAAANSCTWTGDDSPTERDDAAGTGAGRTTAASISVASQDSANAITATFAVSSTTDVVLAAAAWR